MLKAIKTIFLFSLILMVKSCVEPFEPNISKYVNVFVVDGEINNLPGPYEVRLTGGYKYDGNSGINVTGALVKIIESTGLEIVLQESGEGVYLTDSGFRARIGNSY